MPSTRRAFLRSAAGLATVLAGCGADPTPDSSPTTAPRGPPRDALADPAMVRLRRSGRRPVVRRPDATDDEAEDEESDAGADRWWHLLVTDAETADSLTFADSASDDVAAARRFLADTDFDSASVYVEQFVVPECYDRELCWIRWTEDRVETDYVRVLRDADVPCETAAEDVLASLFRLPVALNSAEGMSYGSGVGGGRCRTPEGGRS